MGTQSSDDFTQTALLCSQFRGKSKQACVNRLPLHPGAKLPVCGSKSEASWWAQRERKKKSMVLSSWSDLGRCGYKEFHWLFDGSYLKRTARLLKLSREGAA